MKKPISSSRKILTNYRALKAAVGGALVVYGSAASIGFANENGPLEHPPHTGKTFAGQALAIQSFDDLSVRFFGPDSVVFDAQCNVYFADRGSSTVRKITDGGEVSTIAGKAGERGDADGTGEAARFSGPRDIAIDANGNLYVTDGHAIRKITQSGVVTTVAGSVNTPGETDGQGSAARFRIPEDIVADKEGNLFVADLDNDRIRKIDTNGTVSTLAGISGGGIHNDGSLATAQFTGPLALTFDRSGHLYVLDVTFPPSNFEPSNISYIRRIDLGSSVTSIVSSTSPLAELQNVARLETMGIDRFGCTGRHVSF